MRRILPRRPYVNIVGHKYVWFTISGIIVIVAAVALATKGLNFGIDFKGGTELDIRCRPGTTISQVRGAAARLGYGTAQIQAGQDNAFIVRTPKLDDQKKKALTDSINKDGAIEKTAKGDLDVSINEVGPGWGSQVSRQAIIALAVFIIAILIYISIRFEFKMAICAIIEIFHDFIITVGVYALVGRQVTPATVVAVLTILGYSLYDSVVIFDRIKENTDQLTRQSRKTYSQTVNDSVNQVLARSINTSLTTLIPILALLLFGGETLKAFAFALFVGVLSGTYSSIILAPPILSVWKETEPKYKSFRERVERKQTREARIAREGAAKAAPGGASSALVKPKPAVEPEAAQAPAGKVDAGPKPAPAVAREGAAPRQATPKPGPKPARKAAATTGRSAAKARTKGPGSGKKKKKKKR